MKNKKLKCMKQVFICPNCRIAVTVTDKERKAHIKSCSLKDK